MHPVAFHLGSLPIYWYGILMALAFVVGLWTASRRCVRDALSPDAVVDAGVWLILGTLVGARLLYVITYWGDQFAGRPWTDIFMVRHGGLVFYGGLIGASLAIVLYVRLKLMPLWRLADALAPSIPLGQAIGRVGCLMFGCCYGRPTTVPWAIHFPADHPTHGVGVHPTQIYESLLSLALYAALATLYRRKRFHGQVFAAYLVGYAVLRSVVECFRGDYTSEFVLGIFTPGQFAGIFIGLAGAALWWRLSRTPSPPPSRPPR
ncbi:MAG: prolipoprotein diacylglyceryl transferase [Verrucomicrobia bacterium]|nr:prolipoprotein diacylglyceryl transferase [Verrucomicrobiota bacterium]